MRAIIRKVKLVNLKKGAWGFVLLFTSKYCCNFDVRAFHIALTFSELNWHVYPLYCSAWDYLFWFAANNIVYKQTSMVLHIRLCISTFLQTFMPSSITVLELCECEQNERCSSRIQGETLVRPTLIFETKWWPTQRTAPWTGIVTLSVEDYIPKSCPDTLRHCYASCIPFVTERLRATCTAAKNRTGCPPCREVTTPHWICDKAAE
jgi:hypothetical protein